MKFAELLNGWKEAAAWRDVAFAPAPAIDAPTLPPLLTPVRLVFVNGFYRPDLSQTAGLPEGFMRPDGAGGWRIDVAAQTCLALQPLGFLFVDEAQAPSYAEATIKISLGNNSRLTLIEEYDGAPAAPFLFAPAIELDLAPQAKLVHGKILRGTEKNLHAARAQVRVSAGAFYDSFTLVCGGALTRCASEIHLAGELAGANVAGAMLLRGAQTAQKEVRLFHEAPSCTSRQSVKAVLDGAARGSFLGCVHVVPTAQKTDAHQLCRALLLSDRAEMKAQPELEIYADDVKCGHGSAIAQPSEEEMFYLRSRGLPYAQARALLIAAFVDELIEKIPSPEIAQAAGKEAQVWLSTL